MPRAFPYLATKVCNILAPFAMEFVGTFFLVAAVGFNSVSAHPLAPLGIGLTLVVCIFAGGHISGAHYNPAVTLAVWMSRRNKIGGLDAIIYVVVQVAAAFLAALFSWSITDKTVAVQPAVGVSEANAFGVEAVWTFLLATVVLQTATTETQAGNSFFGLSIGSTVIAGAITVGPISGGVFNPAVGTGMLLAYACDTNHTEKLRFLWIYWLAPLLGGLVAGIMFWFTNRREFHDEPRLEGDAEHLFSMDVKSIADISAQKREGGKIIKGMVKRERERFEYLFPDENALGTAINLSE